MAEVRKMVDLLARLRTAPLVDPYSGPAILSGRAAGVFFHEIFGHRVEANRQRSADDGQTFAQPRRPAGAARVPERRLRSDAEEASATSS